MQTEVWRRRLRHLGHFFLAQGSSQLLGTAAGLLCVRALAVTSYAEYSVIFAILGSLLVLTDIGFSGTLTSLVGERLEDVDLIADYVSSIRVLRTRLFFIVSPAACLFFVWLTRRQAWSVSLTASMLAMLLASLWFNAVSSSYGAVLILKRDRGYYYRIQLYGGLIRLGGILLLIAFHWLNAVLAVLVGVIASIVLAWGYYQRAKQFLVRTNQPPRRLERDVITLALPNIPSTIFYAFQGQVSIFLITYFGHPGGIAGVGALARIGQLFLLVSTMNGILIEPFFASLARHKLVRTYLYTVLTAVAAVSLVVAIAAIWPRSLLIILGPKYEGLTHEVVWTVGAAVASYMSGLLWSIHIARRFVFWWATWLNMVALVVVQIVFALRVDLSTITGVVIMGFAGALAGMLINVAVGIVGLIRGPRLVTN